ncbi:12236_t:CDS:10 [Entrophospora sp. SA101]|nr:12236_t:CDS:10 [Entrophospora sp. SA101]CAJ0913374.1 16627_t:CDS:10 [Entrophospora sp. SA101]
MTKLQNSTNTSTIAIGYYNSQEDLDSITTVSKSREFGYDFVVLPLTNTNYKRFLFENVNHNNKETVGLEKWRNGMPLTLDDLVIKTADNREITIGKIPEWINLDSSDQNIRINSEIALKQQLSWATHLGLTAVLIPFPSELLFNYARCLNSIFSGLLYTQIWIKIPLTIDDSNDRIVTWERWNKIRTLCDHHFKLNIALELTANLPDEHLIEKWYAEPLKAVILSIKIFLKNAKGYPVLNQQQNTNEELSNYHEYLRYLNQSSTYETFEKDPIKYQLYEKAIYHALLDRVPFESDEVTVIMVVGAGRGPLVTKSLIAAEKAKRKIKVYAVEKNPNAFVVLQNKKLETWGDEADIMVSELLGSFGDNELSPECLDGAQKFLKSDGISIPSSYTTYIAPLSSHKLYNEVASYKDLVHFETPYVVMFQQVNLLSDPKELWNFHHPNKNIKFNNHDIHFWRLTNNKKVWYEWSTDSQLLLNKNDKDEENKINLDSSIIHNVEGRSSWIGL